MLFWAVAVLFASTVQFWREGTKGRVGETPLTPVEEQNRQEARNIIAVTLVSYFALPLCLITLIRSRIRNVEEDIQDLDFEIDLQYFAVSKSESRGEKILRINNVQLRRYYDLNLQQNIWIFFLGIFCILIGTGVIGATLYLVLNRAQGTESQIITGAIGSIGSLVTNYIAAIYLKMHAAAAADLGSFHSRLVETNELLLGNLLASRIEDDQKRWDTLAQLALNLSKNMSK